MAMNEPSKPHDFASYVATVQPAQACLLEHVRDVTLKLVPSAQETISYGMPVLKYKGAYLLGFAAFKDHMSVFPGSEAIEQLNDKLDSYKIAKGTVQFTAESPLTDELLAEIVRLCVARIDDTK